MQFEPRDLNRRPNFSMWLFISGIGKKLLATSKTKDCNLISSWIIKYHVYWSAQSTAGKFISQIL